MTAKKIEELQKRSLKEMDIRAVFIDSKRFRSHGVIIALGVAFDGRKYVFGIYQSDSDTENSEYYIGLLNDLESHDLPERALLFIVDGGSGLNKALNVKYHCYHRSAEEFQLAGGRSDLINSEEQLLFLNSRFQG